MKITVYILGVLIIIATSSTTMSILKMSDLYNRNGSLNKYELHMSLTMFNNDLRHMGAIQNSIGFDPENKCFFLRYGIKVVEKNIGTNEQEVVDFLNTSGLGE